MLTTGVEALDIRLGGLRAGSMYAFFGPHASGKTELGLHFLMQGLERNQKCVLITRDEPSRIDSRAAYLGYSPNHLTLHPQLQLIRLPDRIPTNLTLTP